MDKPTRRDILKYGGGAAFAAGAVALGGPGLAWAGEPSSSAKPKVAGQPTWLLLPGDPDFDAEKVTYNPVIQHHPYAIAIPTTDAEVAAAVAYGRSNNWPIAIQSTGHGIGVPADNALLINTRHMSGVRVDPLSQRVTLQAGVTWGAVIAEAQKYGLAPMDGSSPDVGAIGLISGGGHSVMGRRYGYDVDNVESFRIVTADGKLRCASPLVNPDLFYAVRGGKSNFGLVTSLTMPVFPHTRYYGGSLAYLTDTADDARRILHAFADWANKLDVNVTSSVTLQHLPPYPPVPPAFQNKYNVTIYLVSLNSEADSIKLVKPLRDLIPDNDAVGEFPYTQIATVYNDPLGPQAFPLYERTGLLRKVDYATFDALVGLAGPGSGFGLPFGLFNFRMLGGRFAQSPAIPNAIGHRDAAAILFGSGDPQGLATVMNGLSPYLTGGYFPNFMNDFEATPDQVPHGYEPATWARLRQIKGRWDPSNVFHINHNIPPA